jgi:membrane protease subunit HflC
MKAERLAEAELIRASGNEEKQRKIAVADRESVEIIASAQKDAEILRGEGDAARNRIFAEAFTKDPGFFEFYRSMNAYASSLATPDTTMVISPESEFFRFFGDSAGIAPGKTDGAATGQ